MTPDGAAVVDISADVRATLLSFLLIMVGLFSFALAIRVSPGRSTSRGGSSDVARGSKSPRDTSSRTHTCRTTNAPRPAIQPIERQGTLSRRDSAIFKLKEELEKGSSSSEPYHRSYSADALPATAADVDRPASSRSSNSFWSMLDEDRDTTLLRAGSVMSEYLLSVDGYSQSGGGCSVSGSGSGYSGGAMYKRYPPSLPMAPGKQRRASGSIYRRATSSTLPTSDCSQLSSRTPRFDSILEMREKSSEKLPQLRSCISEDITREEVARR